MDTDLFWNGVLDRPFRLFGLDHIYLAPGSEKRIDSHPDLGNIDDYILPAGVVAQALKREELVVYDVRGPRLRNITDVYAALPRDTQTPAARGCRQPADFLPARSRVVPERWRPSLDAAPRDPAHGRARRPRPEALSARQLPGRTAPRRAASRHRRPWKA